MEKKIVIAIMLSFLLGSAVTGLSANQLPSVYHLVDQLYIKIGNNYYSILDYLKFQKDKIVVNKQLDMSGNNITNVESVNTSQLCIGNDCKASWSEVGGRTPCSKGLAKLSQNQFQGNHNCDDNPSNCCPAGYRMCTESELNQYFAMGCIDFDSYDQWGWFNFTTYIDVNCNGWTTNSNSEYGADAKTSISRTYDRWNDLVAGPEYRYFGHFPQLFRGSSSCSISSYVNCNPGWRCKGGIDRTYYNRNLNSNCVYGSGYGITYTRGASCDTYRKVWCCPD